MFSPPIPTILLHKRGIPTWPLYQNPPINDQPNTEPTVIDKLYNKRNVIYAFLP